MGTPTNKRDAFTLIEVMLAVAILIVLTVTVYQFTAITLRATDLSMQNSEQTMQFGGFRRLLETQLSALPAGQHGALIGMNIKGKGAGRRDALQLVCPAGNALLTPDARGFYQVTLDLREAPRGSGHFALGLERQPWTDDDEDDEDDDASTPLQKPGANGQRPVKSPLPSDWLPLMDNVQSLEIAYFDARLNGWVDKWVDTSVLPNLVRVRLTTAGSEAPYEIVERVPGGGIARNPLPAGVQAYLNNNGGSAGVRTPTGLQTGR